MRTRFYKRIKVLPGVTLNIGRRGISVSFGRQGAKVTYSKTGARKTFGVPGSGLFITSQRKYGVQQKAKSRNQKVLGEKTKPNWYIPQIVRFSVSGIVPAGIVLVAIIFVVSLSMSDGVSNGVLGGGFVLLFLAIALFVVGLISPRIVGQPNREAVFEVSFLYVIVAVVLIGFVLV